MWKLHVARYGLRVAGFCKASKLAGRQACKLTSSYCLLPNKAIIQERPLGITF